MCLKVPSQPIDLFSSWKISPFLSIFLHTHHHLHIFTQPSKVKPCHWHWRFFLISSQASFRPQFKIFVCGSKDKIGWSSSTNLSSRDFSSFFNLYENIKFLSAFFSWSKFKFSSNDDMRKMLNMGKWGTELMERHHRCERLIQEYQRM